MNEYEVGDYVVCIYTSFLASSIESYETAYRIKEIIKDGNTLKFKTYETRIITVDEILYKLEKVEYK